MCLLFMYLDVDSEVPFKDFHLPLGTSDLKTRRRGGYRGISVYLQPGSPWRFTMFYQAGKLRVSPIFFLERRGFYHHRKKEPSLFLMVI